MSADTGDGPPSRFTETVGPLEPPGDIRIHPIGTVIADRYEIRGVLGRGGFAVVYSAWDTLLDREVALKVLRADKIGRANVKRFRREAALARDLRHPNLARVYDIGTADGELFISMSRVEGRTLRERIDEGPFDLDEILDVASQILVGLGALHELGIVHRDVKPSNVLVTTSGRVKLADFGLARRPGTDETRATETKRMVGTAGYVSPEQVLDPDVDARSDLYSFGVVLFEMLTGETPHGHESSMAILLAHVYDPAPPVRSLRPDVPRWLDRILRKLLAKSPDDRYRSAADVLSDLEGRRPPRDLRLVGSLVATAAVVIFVLAGLLRPAQEPGEPTRRFSHAEFRENPKRIQGIDSDGSVLWEIEAARPCFGTARLPGRDGPYVVAILTSSPSARGMDPAESRILSILDPETGRIEDTLELPTAAHYFSELGDEFAPGIRVEDLDGDGFDEILVTYVHVYWPSYTVLFEPLVRRARVVMVASGHHRPVGPADLDGDGAAELLFAGHSNRIGYYGALAAVDVEPGVNETGQELLSPALTPDLDRGGLISSLLWYDLLPRTACGGRPACVSTDHDARTIRVRSDEGPGVLLGFHGFPVDDGIATPIPERAAARARAYRHIREAVRRLDQGYPPTALEAVRKGIEASIVTADPQLTEWLRLLEIRCLVAAGRSTEARQKLRTLVAESPSPSDVARFGAEAFHFSGFLEEAVAWYRRSFEESDDLMVGYQADDAAMGLAFALGELGRWAEALEEVRRLRDPGHSSYEFTGVLVYLRWRMGRASEELPESFTGAGLRPDYRYWVLETEWAAGASPEDLLPRIADERRADGMIAPLLDSLAAEIYRSQGRLELAVDMARLAFEETLAESDGSVFHRAHLDLVAERFARLLQEVGRHDEATEVLERAAERLATRAVVEDPAGQQVGD